MLKNSHTFVYFSIDSDSLDCINGFMSKIKNIKYSVIQRNQNKKASRYNSLRLFYMSSRNALETIYEWPVFLSILSYYRKEIKIFANDRNNT